jgi:hypothetical protein
MPKPVRELLRLVHVEQIDLSQVRREDFEVISYLKSHHPDLYKNLRRAARSKTQGAPLAEGTPFDDLPPANAAGPLGPPLSESTTISPVV